MSHPDDPRIPRPCPVPVSAMEPREKGDLCRACDTMVLDTARHTRAEFLAIVARGDEVCAQLRSDGAGRVRFADSPVKKRLAVVALSAALAACGEDVGITQAPPRPPPEVEHAEWVGQVVAPPEATPTIRGEVSAPETPPVAVPPAEPVPAPHHGTRRGRVAAPSADDGDLVGLVE